MSLRPKMMSRRTRNKSIPILYRCSRSIQHDWNGSEIVSNSSHSSGAIFTSSVKEKHPKAMRLSHATVDQKHRKKHITSTITYRTIVVKDAWIEWCPHSVTMTRVIVALRAIIENSKNISTHVSIHGQPLVKDGDFLPAKRYLGAILSCSTSGRSSRPTANMVRQESRSIAIPHVPT